MPDSTQKQFLNDEQLVQVEKLSQLGMSLKDISYIIGVSKSTMDRRRHDQPEVLEAIEKGKAVASAAVRGTAFRMATSGKNAVMTIFWLKCRENWRESSEIVDTDSNVVKLAYVPKSERG